MEWFGYLINFVIVYLFSAAISYVGVLGWIIEDGLEEFGTSHKCLIFVPVLNSLTAISVFFDELQKALTKWLT